ncbi:MAG: 50S ribosomal protein L29 [Actinomycetota bacterium]|jgi:large subunit ribosomal protein L29|nr:50S ribosomal protein L29 [Actinomycetota bacterium]
MTTAAELRELDDDELENRLANARKELFNLRFQAATGRLDNTARTGFLRRDIARMLTVMGARQAGLSPAQVRPAQPSGGRLAGRLRLGEMRRTDV